ncbi:MULTISPECIES: hypothetical protein [unclassified Janthinobacterium]|uniref:hypothetical protein n=1 Tax=unclassified Janthinobacterium TaxID=2610881 RepID=UPI0003480795|nr:MULTISPECIES: hypothetical protein [unclassified Janthinobacterium]MEC5161489.1 hypothetical protein [Janthinobacterium sp. CG_S6]
MSQRRNAVLAALLAAALACQPAAARSARAGETFQFGVIGHSFQSGPDDSELRQAIRDTNQANLAFVVATGIKADSESCSDKLYARRVELLDESEWPLVVSLAASDWSGCKNSAGRSNAIDRLNRLRELFFADDNSLGARKLALARLSANAKFRSYAENSQWESGRVLFATINLPANNNHFLPEAGRNSEFEDRLVANRSWLQRLFAAAQRKKLDGIVLFSDGDVGVQNEDERSLLPSFNTKQDGFAVMRRQIRTLAKKFSGKVLLIDTKRGKNPPAPAIEWNDNLGHVSVNAGWVRIQVNPGRANLFDIKNGEAQ